MNIYKMKVESFIEGRSRASYGLTRPDFVHHFPPRKPAL